VQAAGQASLLVTLCTMGCGAPAAQVAWQLCPVTRSADGRDIDDGGVDVGIEIRGSSSQRLSLGHFSHECHRLAATTPTLECTDPHRDVRYELVWVRPSPGRLVIEQREYALPTVDGSVAPTSPATRRKLAVFDVPGASLTEVEPRCP